MHASRSRVTAVAAAVLLVLSSTGETAAVTWGAPLPITESGAAVAMPNALATFGTNGSLVAYHEVDVSDVPRVHVRSGGGTVTRISGAAAPAAYWASLANYRRAVDAAWVQETASTRVVKYRSSADGGTTWGKTATLSASTEVAGIPRVARNAAGHVAAVWTNQLSGKVRVRVSTDGGATFSARMTLGSTTYQPWDDGWYDAFPTIALTGGAIIAVYHKNPWTLVMRRSTNRGATWSAERILATDAFGNLPTVQASGKTVLLGYARASATDVWTVARRSGDGGATWGSATAIARKAAPFSFEPVFSTAGGRWRVLYEQCGSEACERSVTLYRDSIDGGLTWSASSRASGTSGYNLPAGVGSTSTGPLAAWTRFSFDDMSMDVMLGFGSDGGSASTDSASGSGSVAEGGRGAIAQARERALERLAAPVSR
jgi:hypothetical protein